MKDFQHHITLFFIKTESNFRESARNLTKISFARRQEPIRIINLPIFHLRPGVPDMIAIITQTRHNNREIIDINS
jgi:hypothetical protein